MAAAVPRAMSRWDLPVPESPIRHSGWPLRTHSQLARVLITAGVMAGWRRSRSRSAISGGEPGAPQPPLSAPVVAVFAFGHEQLGQEACVGELVMLGLVGGLGEPGTDGG